MRTVDIEIGGVSYPLCLTLGVYADICQRYGDMKSCYLRLDEVAGQYEKDEETGKVTTVVPEDTEGLIGEYLWLLSVLLDGGQAQKALIGAPCIVPRNEPVPKAPTSAELTALLSPGDVPYIQRKVHEALRAGHIREVDAVPPKNGAGPAAGAPNG